MKMGMSEDEAKDYFKKLDKDGSGALDMQVCDSVRPSVRQ